MNSSFEKWAASFYRPECKSELWAQGEKVLPDGTVLRLLFSKRKRKMGYELTDEYPIWYIWKNDKMLWNGQVSELDAHHKFKKMIQEEEHE